MTQRVARPMKFAAFISIIISVAVIFAACQGAVGPKGDTGDSGDAGQTGDRGPAGISQLVAVSAPAPILINDVTDEGVITIGAGPTGLSAATYFRGGKEPITYKSVRTVPGQSNQTFNLTVAPDGAITIAKVAEPSADAGAPFMTGDSFTITATDADGVAVPTPATVKRNRVPVKTADISNVTGIDNNSETGPLTIGAQDDFSFDASADARKDVCMALNTFCVSKMELEGLFDNTDGDTGMTYVIREKNPDNVTAMISSDGKLVITGHEPLLDGTVAKAVRIFFKAKDSGGLESAEHVVWLRVNPEIDIADGLLTSKSLKAAGVAEPLVRDVDDFFTSKNEVNETDTVAVRLVGADDVIIENNTAVTNNFFDVVIDSSNNILQITPKNVGSGEVVIIATTDNSQWVTHTITITVTANS